MDRQDLINKIAKRLGHPPSDEEVDRELNGAGITNLAVKIFDDDCPELKSASEIITNAIESGEHEC